MRLAIMVLCVAVAAFGQRSAATQSPFRPMPPPAGTTPTFGNILYPGGINQTHPARLGATISGRPFPGVHPGMIDHGRPRTIVVPYAVPVWTGGYYGGGYYGAGYYDGGMPYAQQQPVTVVMPQQSTPQIVINNYTDGVRTSVAATEETGGLRVYEASPAAKPAATAATGSYVRDDKPNIYMIVLRDKTIVEAIGYWVKDGMLHYVTPEATIRQVDIDLLDREASTRLNATRKLEFEIR